MSWLGRALLGAMGLLGAPLGPVNRQALVVRPKQPVADWNNACAPDGPISAEITLANRHVILIDVETDLDDWLEVYGVLMFKWMLNGCFTDPALWPEDLSVENFREWCDLELIDSVLDVSRASFRADE